VIPAGVGGNTSRDMLARLDKDVLSKKPDWMTLSCGVNDVWHGANGGVPLDQYQQNITSIVDQATAAGIKVVILTSTMITEDEATANNQQLVATTIFFTPWRPGTIFLSPISMPKCRRPLPNKKPGRPISRAMC